MKYTELSRAIKSFLENDFPDFVAANGTKFSSGEQIATFVRQAEQRIYNTVQLPAIRKNSVGNLIAGDKYIGLPTDFLAPFAFAVVKEDGNYIYLLPKDVSFIREAYANPSLASIPAHYAQFDHNTFLVGPTPDQNYTVELHYYYYPKSIVDAGNSWLGDNFDSVLLYGALVEGYTHMKGSADLIERYKAQYMEALSLLKLLGDAKNKGDSYRNGQVRLPNQ